MPLHKVEVDLNGGRGSVKVDGTPLHGVTGFSLRSRAYEPSEVTLDLVVIDDTRLCDETARVLIPESTRETLIALGWTPPDGA